MVKRVGSLASTATGNEEPGVDHAQRRQRDGLAMVDDVDGPAWDLHLKLHVGERLAVDGDVGVRDGQNGRSTGQALGQELTALAQETADVEAHRGEDEAHRQQHEARDRGRLRPEVKDARGGRTERVEQQQPADDGQDDADDGEDLHRPER